MPKAGTALQVTAERSKLTGWLADRGVNTKVLLSVFVAATAAIVITVVAMLQAARADDELIAMKAKHVDSLQQLSNIRGGIGTMFRGLFLVSSPGTADFRASGQANLKEADVTVAAGLAAYQKSAAGSPARLAALNDFSGAWDQHSGLRRIVLQGGAPEPGIVVPEPAQIGPRFISLEATMLDAINRLQAAEESESAAEAASGSSSYHTARTIMLGCLAAGLLLALGLALLVSRMIRRQLIDVTTSLAGVADGDLTRPAIVRSRDELGQMAAAVNRASAAIRGTVETLSTGARTLGDSTQRLTGVASRLAASADNTARQAAVVTNAAGGVSGNVQTVAAGSEEMGASIREIAQNANEAARVASQAVTAAEATNAAVSKLGRSSAEIGDVVKVITSIAEQTNLLALNATIEAARAGDAGKGFAVVASEVKDLAQETARATEDIGGRVTAIQSDTTSAVQAIEEISRIIGQINDYQNTIAAAVEEQTATTAEMSRSVGEAAGNSSQIASTISEVSHAAQSTTETLSEANQTITELTGLAGDLQTAVGRFRT